MTDTEPTARLSQRPERARQTRTIRLGAGGSTIEVLVGPAETGGTMSIYRWRMSPSSRGPAPHFHTTFSETFTVEEGEVDYFDGRTWRTLLPGDTAHVAMGGVHAIRKERAEPATLLMALSPGVPREEYFAQLATADERDLSRLHEAHDNHFVHDFER
ncbi:cupin [Planomonospora parontospora subsp. parontospora]|uniref:Cupin n=2 Tax=Planomonospora parontospora TaxID=58119 RepID=A0AA37F3F2_9ACTN|nr:cupin domain-containing protein [Planomonospora parontospora]GGK56927.1 cupin [Planomonospora parontospora]GII07714.1 cupin [Planomonospora parontospora subsp. parontospora]